MPKLKTLSLLLNGILILTLTSIIANRYHPYEDPAELMRAMQMGWAIRGLAERGSLEKPVITNFEAQCIGGYDYDKCREAEGQAVIAARLHYGITKALPIPTAQSSQAIEKERP